MESATNIRKLFPGYVIRISEFILIISLLFLCYWQYVHRETTMVKVGLTHLFSPGFVGVIPYLLAGLALLGATCIVFWSKKAAVVPGLILFSLYTGYNIYLLWKTGSSCGCSNIFFDTNLNTQIGIGAGLIGLCFLLLFKRNQAIRQS